jgi:LPXTG-motif cell wall-anchored protein
MRADTQMNNNNNRPRRRTLIGVTAITIGVLATTIGISSSSGLAYTGPVVTDNTSESNEPGYWGPTCTKLDMGDDTSWEADADYTLLVLKSGNFDYAFSNVVEGDVLTIPQDISHFIFCPPMTTTTTITTTTTTTTLPATTTTTLAGTTTTTLAGTTTTAPETSTTLQAQLPPPTTLVASQAATTVAAQLPETGADRTDIMALVGMALVGMGLTLVLGSRRHDAS